MKKFKEFNINRYAKVKLNERGYKILEDYKKQTKEITGIEPSPIKLDENDYYENQLWIIMRIFGSHMCMGLDPFDAIILIEEDK